MPRLSYLEIAQREERRQARGTAEIAELAEPLAGGWMGYGGVGSWINRGVGMGLDGPVSEAELDRLVAFYVSRGAEPRIDVCPFAHETLVRGLAERGFTLRNLVNVLAREIEPGEDLRACLAHGWPEGLRVARVDPADEAQVELFADISTSGFRPEGAPMDELELQSARRMVRHPRCQAFLARVDGEPAGAAAMEVGERSAGLFSTSVLPAFRRRGIQQALIVHRLGAARGRGCLLACVQTRPGIATERNAVRVGFFMAYSKVILAMRGEGLTPSPW